MFNFLIKILSCVLYVARVVMEENLCNQQQQPQQQRDYNMLVIILYFVNNSKIN